MYQYRAKCTVEDCNNAFRNYNYDDYDDDSHLSEEREGSQHLRRGFHNTLVSIFAACRSIRSLSQSMSSLARTRNRVGGLLPFPSSSRASADALAREMPSESGGVAPTF
jgi:hypothetical protein